MKKIFVLLLLISSFSHAQLNNSWIDYTKTYYKFRLAKDTLCRIPQATLAAVGLENTNADYFQLWRNRFIYLSRLVLIQSIFSARRNARALSSAFRSFRSFQNNCTRLSQTSISLGTSLLVTRHAVDR